MVTVLPSDLLSPEVALEVVVLEEALKEALDTGGGTGAVNVRHGSAIHPCVFKDVHHRTPSGEVQCTTGTAVDTGDGSAITANAVLCR
jgi:hypothetical protein